MTFFLKINLLLEMDEDIFFKLSNKFKISYIKISNSINTNATLLHLLRI